MYDTKKREALLVSMNSLATHLPNSTSRYRHEELTVKNCLNSYIESTLSIGLRGRVNFRSTNAIIYLLLRL